MSLRDLHRTYGAVRPELGPVALLGLTVHGVLSYAAYWARLVTIPVLSRRAIDNLVHHEGLEDVLESMAQGRGQVFVLIHQGHWELAGAWAVPRLGGLSTVAEALPEGSLMGRVTAWARARAGLDVILAEPGSAPARHLVRVLRRGGAVALLVDRDLVDRGFISRQVQVNLAGVRTTFAAGPAELALATGADLRPVTVTTRGLRTPPHRVVFGAAVPVGDGSTRERVEAMTQACADVLGVAVRRHTSDWHMLAPVVGVTRESPQTLAAEES